MFVPGVLLLATYTTFGPIAQDNSSLYVAVHGSIVRVDKNDPAKRTTLTPPTTRRIAAIDVDGDLVYYATAPDPVCLEVPTFGTSSPFVHYDCSLTDTEMDHELRSVLVGGGDDHLVLRQFGGITEIAHDAEWLYWFTPSTAVKPAGAALLRKRKGDNSWNEIASNLIVSAVNQHPFALAGESVYVISGSRLLRIWPSGAPPDYVSEVGADSTVEMVAGTVYFGYGADVGTVDAATGAVGYLRFPLVPTAGATGIVSILGGAPGHAVISEGAGWTHTIFRGWIMSDLCAHVATLLYSMTDDYFHAYFIPPLIDPPTAVDDRGIYVNDRRVVTFASPPEWCGRRRAAVP